MISIAHIFNRREFMRRLWEHAKKPIHLTFYGIDEQLDEKELDIAITRFTDSLCGRIIKVDVTKKEVFTEDYDKVNGNGMFKFVLNTYFPKNLPSTFNLTFCNKLSYIEHTNMFDNSVDSLIGNLETTSISPKRSNNMDFNEVSIYKKAKFDDVEMQCSDNNQLYTHTFFCSCDQYRGFQKKMFYDSNGLKKYAKFCNECEFPYEASIYSFN